MISSDEASLQRWRRAGLFALLLVLALALALAPQQFDRPFFAFVNSAAGESRLLDFGFVLFGFMSMSSLPLVALVWACWFSSPDVTRRGRVLVSFLVAFGAGVFSRMLQYTLPTHPRPALDPAIHFRIPFDVDPSFLNTWNSFPSDHATVLGGLALVNFVIRAPWRWAAAALLVFTEGSRIYVGAHYPTDILGGLGLAGLLVWASQADPVIRLGRAVASWEKMAAPLFYFLAFCLSYQIVTLFSEPRYLATLIFDLRHLL
jgi:membrane-associated phospholipid phosphatase